MEKLLVGIHAGVASISGRMEWLLDTDAKIYDGATEAAFLAKSIKDVADHYGQGLLDQKTLDWMNLIQCLGMVYGTRAFVIMNSRQPKAAPKPKPHDFRAGPPPQFHPGPERNGHTVMPPNVMVTDAPPLPEGAEVGEIPGVASVEFPPDHPMMKKH